MMVHAQQGEHLAQLAFEPSGQWGGCVLGCEPPLHRREQCSGTGRAGLDRELACIKTLRPGPSPPAQQGISQLSAGRGPHSQGVGLDDLLVALLQLLHPAGVLDIAALLPSQANEG